jgi:hypothetical protein
MFIQRKSVVGNNKSFPLMYDVQYMLKKPNGGIYFLNQSIIVRLPLLLKPPIRYTRSRSTVAKFIVPDWEDKVAAGIGLTYRPGYIDWSASTTATLAGVNFIPPVRAYEFGFWCLVTT